MLAYLTKQFGKANLPDIRPGDTIRVSFKVREGEKTRLQTVEGICIGRHKGQTLDASIKLRKIGSGIGIERTFPLHSPLISKFEKIKSRRTRRAKLYFLRDFVGKKAKKIKKQKDYKLWEEALSEEEISEIEAQKTLAAEKKAAQKELKQAELDKKYQAAIASHSKEKSKDDSQKATARQSGGGPSPRDS